MASSLNEYFINSALDITKLSPPSEVSPSPTVDTHPVFDLEEITEVEVKNIISGLRGSKARDAYDFDTDNHSK